MADIYDLAWSPDGTHLACAQVDHSVNIFNVATGAVVQTLTDHTHYVQGVSWDPRGELLATQSSDRTCRVFRTAAVKGRSLFKPSVKLDRLPLPADAPEQTADAGDKQAAAGSYRIFADESISSFFRRLSFSPDGSLLVVPAAQLAPQSSSTYGALVFSRADLSRYVRCMALY